MNDCLFIQKNLDTLKQEIEGACAQCGRQSSEITLVTVSKTQPIEKIKAAMDCGITLFGESRAQELEERFGKIHPLPEIHFIGHLQRNKIAKVLPFISTVHSVDKLETAVELDKQSKKTGKKTAILFEANTSGEETKSGVRLFDDLFKLVEQTMELDSLEPQGLMTMAPWGETEQTIRRCFSQLRVWCEKISRGLQNPGFKILSMGMSDDFPYAILEGATIIRVGTRLFGGRNA